MRQQDWTEQLRQRLAEHEEPVPADLWAGIEQRLGPSAVSDGTPASQKKGGRRARIIMLRWSAAAACVLLLIGTWLLTRRDDNVIISTSPAIAMSEAEAPSLSEDMPIEEETVELPATEPHKTHKSIVPNNPTEPNNPIEPNNPTEPNNPIEPIEPNNPTEPTNPINPNHPIEPISPSPPYVPSKPHPRPTLSLHATNLLASNGNTLTEPLQMSSANMGYIASNLSRTTPVYLMNYTEEMHHDMPLTFGLSLRLPLAQRWWLSTGIDYSLVKSSFTHRYGYNVTHNRQHLHYIGAPLTLGYTFWQTPRLTAYGSGGGEAMLNVAAHIDHGHIERDRLQFSLLTAAGLEYRLLPHLGIYVQPGLRYYPDNGSRLQNIFKEHPLQIDLQIGLRYTR